MNFIIAFYGTLLKFYHQQETCSNQPRKKLLVALFH